MSKKSCSIQGNKRISDETKAHLAQLVKENVAKGMSHKNAMEKAAKTIRADLEADVAYLTKEASDQLGIDLSIDKPKTEPRKRAEKTKEDVDEPVDLTGDLKPSRVFGHVENPVTLLDKAAAVGKAINPLKWSEPENVKARDSAKDFMGNKLLGKAFSVLDKMYSAGDTGVWSKVNAGRVSAEYANSTANNAFQLSKNAVGIGHLHIDKRGLVTAVEDAANNAHTLQTAHQKMTDRLLKMGYKEKGENKNDTDTVANMMALAVYGPRMHKLVMEGHMDARTFTKTDKAISDRLRADPELAKSIEEFHGIYNNMRSKALDALVESGTFTREKATEFLDRSEYLPLYRMDAEMTAARGEPTTISSMITAAKEHHLSKGSMLAIGDPGVNALNNLAWLNMRAIKNNAANIMGESLVAIKAAEFKKFGNTKDKSVLEFNREGKPAFLHLNDINDASAFNAAPVLTGMGWNMARGFTNMLRTGVTAMPSFVWNQLSQDAQRVSVISGKGLPASYADAAANVVRNMAHVKNESPNAKLLRAFGIIGAKDYADAADHFRVNMFEKKESKYWHVFHHMNRLAEASDAAARENIFKTVMERTGDAAEAAHSARMLIDFNNRGNSRTLAAVLTMVPFLNARIQGTHRIADAMRGRIPGMTPEQAKGVAMRKIATMMAVTTAHTIIMSEDDEYNSISNNVKNANLVMPFGLKLSLASEFAPFVNIAREATLHAMGSPYATLDKSQRALWDSVNRVLIGPSDIMPAMAKPLVEGMTNHSFFTKHDLVGKSLQRLDTNKQYTDSTSGLAKLISDAFQATGSEVLQVSPIKIDNAITGHFGTMGGEALKLLKALEAGFDLGERAAPKLKDVPVFGAFFADTQGNAMREDFQRIRDKVDSANSTYNALLREGKHKEANEYRAEHGKIMNLHRKILPIEQQLTAISKQWKLGDKTAANRDERYRRTAQALHRVNELTAEAGL